MLRIEDNERLTQVGPGTPMGELMRRYWHPIAGSAELKEDPTKAVRVLAENLVLYRDRSGTLGLIQESCPHRRVNLLYGIPEQEGLRCPYHGWRFNEKGQCLEMPAEAPDSTFKERVTAVSYPVREQRGLVFAYMGPGDPPLIPNWGPWMQEDVLWDVGWAIVPCNWLQIMENSLDPVHTEWLHRYLSRYVLQRLEETGKRTKEKHWRPPPPVIPHKKVGFDVYAHGIVKRRVLEGGSEDDVSWRIGHPVVFPNMLSAGQIRVPVDDANTLYIWYQSHPMGPGDKPQERSEDVPVYQVPLPGVDDRGQPTWELLDNNSGQDNMAWMSQGPVSQRWLEKLGESDKGIILYRRLLKEQMAIVEDGGDPMNVIRDPARNVNLYVPNEAEEGDTTWGYRKMRSFEGGLSTGSSGKYSVIGRQQAAKHGAVLADDPGAVEKLAGMESA